MDRPNNDWTGRSAVFAAMTLAVPSNEGPPSGADALRVSPKSPDLVEADIVEAVADLLVQRGYCFIPDAKLPEMRQALGPFLINPQLTEDRKR